MSEKIKKYREDYIYNKVINLYHFFTKEQIELISKLGHEIEQRLYTVYEYDKLLWVVLKYHKTREKLQVLGIANEKYDELLDVFDKISNEYNL